MTCKDCLHNDVCCRLIKPSEFIEINEQADDCNLFKDKSRFIELPCRVGSMTVKREDGELVISNNVSDFFTKRFMDVH